MPDPHQSSPRSAWRRPTGPALIGAGLLVLGGVVGAGVVAETRPSVSMAPLTPVPIRALSSVGVVTIRGRVAEIYGNKFVMDDGTGRALVDTGRDGDNRDLVTAGEAVLVQGRFERGCVHAAFLVGPDRRALALGPLAGPPHGPHDGPDHGPGPGPGTPPPPVDGKAPPPPASPAGQTAADPAHRADVPSR